MQPSNKLIKKCIAESNSREDLWVNIIKSCNIKCLAEIGVYKGDFAKALLSRCNHIEKYYMIDPWRHLENWNKPANKSDDIFEQYFLETKSKTDFAAEKREILRGKTNEIINAIYDNELDFAYIDGDHTLRGITIDLINIYEKIKNDGWIGGDDFGNTIWQHKMNYDPTLVCPFAVYFAEAVNARIYVLPYGQFLIEKNHDHSFSLIDHTNFYKNYNLSNQLNPDEIIKLKLKERYPSLHAVYIKLKHLLRTIFH